MFSKTKKIGCFLCLITGCGLAQALVAQDRDAAGMEQDDVREDRAAAGRIRAGFRRRQ